jgi:hypothetical protein
MKKEILLTSFTLQGIGRNCPYREDPEDLISQKKDSMAVVSLKIVSKPDKYRRSSPYRKICLNGDPKAAFRI